MARRRRNTTTASLPAWREAQRAAGRRLVVTNGCFDLLHLGHVTYLESARNCGDALLIGVNSDRAVSTLKGPQRPVNEEADRALVLASLESVSAVCIFDSPAATDFLSLARPDIYVKGGDYDIDTLPETALVRSWGGRAVAIPFVAGYSTSALLQRVRAAR